MKKPTIPHWGVLCAVVMTAHAAPVTWTTGPTPTVDENSISLNGRPYHAGSFGTPAGSPALPVTVGSETIIFDNVAEGAALGLSNAAATGGTYTNGDVWIPPGAANANFNTIMDSVAPDGDNPKVVRIGGLTPGGVYQIQLFVSDDRGCCGARTMEWSDNPTDGAGAETATFAVNTSSYVIGTFTADATTQLFYGRGVAQSQNYVNAYVLRDLSPDTDNDGIPDVVENSAAYADFLDPGNPADAALDQDNDQLSNVDEYRLQLSMVVPDADSDGILDGVEVAPPPTGTGTNPKVADTDGDTLSDGAELPLNGNPLLADTDGDNYPDGFEAQAETLLNDPASVPNGITVSNLGTGGGFLLLSDLTDPNNDISDATPAGTGFNWVSLTSSSTPDFSVEAAANVFDNKVGGGEAKWCCNAAPQHVTVEFASYTSLQYFTVTSSNDAPDRDPRVWEIQGSHDGFDFATIARFDFSKASFWGTQRNQVFRFNLPVRSHPYKYIRYQVYATGSTTQHALGEIEYFGLQSNVDADADGMPKLYEDLYEAFLSDASAADRDVDFDSDGLTNFEEFEIGTRPDLDDTDGDGLEDGEEEDAGSDPFVKDSDGDGLEDGEEVPPPDGYGTSPINEDSDGDFFKDGYEVANGSDPAVAGSTPFGVTLLSLGTGDSALLGGDITDYENNGNDGTAAGSGFDWQSINATSENYFSNPAPNQNEGAYDVFDNKTGGGGAKWCCNAAPQAVTVEMEYPVKLTHFTVTSSNDAPQRDPRVWAIQASNDGVTFTDIFAYSDTTKPVWTLRDEVVRFDLPASLPTYRWFRYSVTSTGSTTEHALGEIEYFGVSQDSDADGMPDFYEDLYGFNKAVNDAGGDADSDLLTNAEEYAGRTSPINADTDDDGLDDGEEINPPVGTSPSNPRLADTDGDGFRDGYEVDNGGNPADINIIPNEFAEITWGTPGNITGTPADFQTGGLLIHAWTGGANAVTAGGIAFQSGPSLGTRLTALDPYTRPGGDANYETLLDAGSSDAMERIVEITGLVPGEQYRVQIWVADTRPAAPQTWQFGTLNSVNPPALLSSGNSDDLTNDSGEWVTGTFTAIADVQYIQMTNPNTGASFYNALTVYQTTGIPENLVVTGAAFDGAVFEITVQGFDTTKSYQLRRSTDLVTFSDVGLPFTPAASTEVVSDPSPPAGKAFYKIQDAP